MGSIDIRQKAKGWLTAWGTTIWGVYIEKIEGKLLDRLFAHWHRLPVHATAIGKVLITSGRDLNALLEGYQYTTFTPATLPLAKPP